jgi:hypothetical protein
MTFSWYARVSAGRAAGRATARRAALRTVLVNVERNMIEGGQERLVVPAW